MEEISEIIAKNVRRLREAREWSQEELANRAGLSLAGVQGVEYRNRWPQPNTLNALAKALEIEPIALFAPQWGFNKPTPLEALEVIREALEGREKAEKLSNIPEESRLGKIIQRLESLGPNAPGLGAIEAALEGLEKMAQENGGPDPDPAEASQVAPVQPKEEK